MVVITSNIWLSISLLASTVLHGVKQLDTEISLQTLAL
jgi:hypothetical protein